MHHGLYSAVVRSLQHYDRLQSHSDATSTSHAASGTVKGSIAEAAGYNEETVIVGRALQKDFEQRGVHLDSHRQHQALQMSEDIATLGMDITQNAGDRAQVGTVEIPDGSWVDELHPAWRSHMNTHLSILGSKSELRMQPKSSTRQGAPLAVPLDQGSVNGIVQNTDNEEVRRQVWLASRQTPTRNKQAIVDFCILRRELAQLLGFKSHSHLQAGLASLAGTPDAVVAFLDQAHHASRPKRSMRC